MTSFAISRWNVAKAGAAHTPATTNDPTNSAANRRIALGYTQPAAGGSMIWRQSVKQAKVLLRRAPLTCARIPARLFRSRCARDHGRHGRLRDEPSHRDVDQIDATLARESLQRLDLVPVRVGRYLVAARQ